MRLKVIGLIFLGFLLCCASAWAEFDQGSSSAGVHAYAQAVQDQVYAALLKDELSWKGSGLFELIIKRDGSLEGVDIARSTGNPKLDEHIMYEIYAIKDFGAFPEDLSKEDHVVLDIEITQPQHRRQ